MRRVRTYVLAGGVGKGGRAARFSAEEEERNCSAAFEVDAVVAATAVRELGATDDDWVGLRVEERLSGCDCIWSEEGLLVLRP